MELDYINVLLGFWLSTVLMAVWKLWWPSILILKIIRPETVILKWQWLSLSIFMILATLVAPLLLPAILIEKYRVIFVSTYIGTMK